MKVTLGEIAMLVDSKVLVKFSEPSVEISPRASYWIERLITIVEREYAEWEKARSKLVQKYGTEKEVEQDGTTQKGWQVLPENIQNYLMGLNEIAVVEIDIAFYPVKLSDLKKINLTPIDMRIMKKFIDPELSSDMQIKIEEEDQKYVQKNEIEVQRTLELVPKEITE